MKDRKELERFYQTVAKDLSTHFPDGLIEVNVRLFRDLDLLTPSEEGVLEGHLKGLFEVLEDSEKMVLINKEFVIWIVSDHLTAKGATFVLIAKNREPLLKPELCFVARGVYNTSSVVVQVLEKILFEISENEEIVSSYENAV